MIKLEEQNGQVMLQEDEIIQKRFLMGNFITQDQLENQQKEWEDVVQGETSQIIGRQGWRKHQEPRVEWRTLLTETRAQ